MQEQQFENFGACREVKFHRARSLKRSRVRPSSSSDFRSGSRLCENAKAINRDRTSYSFKIVSCANIPSAFNFETKSRISFSSRFELLSFHTVWVIRDRVESAGSPAMSVMLRRRHRRDVCGTAQNPIRPPTLRRRLSPRRHPTREPNTPRPRRRSAQSRRQEPRLLPRGSLRL